MGAVNVGKAAGPFHFSGRIPGSKSILNRLLLVKSYFPQLEIRGESKADDVVKMRNALAQLARGEPADCGSAGTTFRFLALKAARMKGTHHLSGSLRLFERPHDELSKVLSQLGVETEFGRQRLTIRGQGWIEPKAPIVVDRSLSSQFASGVIMNAWDLPFDLKMRMEGGLLSESYFQMTASIAKDLGMKIEMNGTTCSIGKNSRLENLKEWSAEPDLSSAFAVAAVAVASKGSVEFLNWPERSLQPDRAFLAILEQMGCEIELTGNGAQRKLRITAGSQPLKPIDWNLQECPDLFPVLGVLCALAAGRSKLHGAPQLAHKESNRIARMAELLKLMNRKVKVRADGMEIEGSLECAGSSITFDTDHDHRLAMAGAVAQAAGFSIRLSDEKVVTKSFPEFWEIVGKPVVSP